MAFASSEWPLEAGAAAVIAVLKVKVAKVQAASVRLSSMAKKPKCAVAAMLCVCIRL